MVCFPTMKTTKFLPPKKYSLYGIHTLVFVQYGDEHLKEIEDLWSALCTWPQNIRSTLNFLARLTCVSGNITIMLQQAKRIMVCFSRTKPTSIVAELMRDLRVCDGLAN